MPLVGDVIKPLRGSPAMSRITGRDRLSWHKSAGGFALHREGLRAPLLHVMPDATHRGMWRIRHPDGRLSDMANLTWAKDGAVALALNLLNGRQAQETAAGAPPVRSNDGASGVGARKPKRAHGRPMSGRGAFNEFAERLVENGFTVTPTRGKVPIIRRWQNPSPTSLDWLRRVLRDNRYPGCNVGIVCGRVVGIDIDADDPANLTVLETLAAEHLGMTPFNRTGRPGRSLLVYRPAGEMIPSIKIGCIDVLAGGKQFVAYGIHPDTERPYQWASSRHNPLSASIGALPVLAAESLQAFAEAVCAALGRPLVGLPIVTLGTAQANLTSRLRTRQGEMLGNQNASGIMRDADGRVTDGRETFMRNLTAAEFARDRNVSPEVLARRVWARFIEEADLSRPKDSNPKQRWQFRDALTKARSTCRRNPDLKPPRRSRGGHPASHLHAWRKPGFWTHAQRELHLAEVGRRITTPAVLAVARVMMDAVDLTTGFCTIPIAEIAKRACCSTKSVNAARGALRSSGLWIAGPGGVFVPVSGELNSGQTTDKKGRKQPGGTIKVPSLYLLTVVSGALSVPSESASAKTSTAGRTYQPDLLGAAIVDLDQYRRGLMSPEFAALIRAEMRARGVTQDELAAVLGISQPQLANALAGRFGLSQEPAARLLSWLREAA
jgi:hypothetical protein